MRRPALLAACVVALALPAGARAAMPRTIDFDDGTGNVGKTYFDNGALTGVAFDDGWNRVASANAHSRPNLADLPRITGPRSVRVDGETDTGLTFPYEHTDVAMRAGADTAANDLPKQSLFIDVLGISGNVLYTYELTPPSSPGMNQPVSLGSAPGRRIKGLQFRSKDAGWAIDDFTYDVPDTPPPPDFGVSWPGRAQEQVTVPPGQTVDVPLDVFRADASSGPVDFAASGLPAGVSATFTPNPASDPASPSTVTMHLTAATDAAAASKQPVTVTAVPGPMAGSENRDVVVPVTVPAQYDLRARGLEITQGAQFDGPNGGLPQEELAPGVAAYRGVHLAAGAQNPTVVRFYTDAAGAPQGGVSATAELTGFDSGGKALPGGPLHPDAGSGLVTDLGIGTAPVTRSERLDDVGPFSFTLPPAWTRADRISLRARVGFSSSGFGAPPTARECAACGGNNVSELRDIGFTTPQFLVVTPVKLVYTDRTKPDAPFVQPQGTSDAPFAAFNRISPVVVRAPAWAGSVDVTTHKVFRGFKGWVTRAFVANNQIKDKDKRSEINSRLEDWSDDRPGATLTFGILTGRPPEFDGSNFQPGQSRGHLFGDRPVANVDANDPLGTVAHELGHTLGRPHASYGCGGGADGEHAENWPDATGTILGVGLDVTQPGKSGGPYRLLSGEAPTYDYMSYCAPKGGIWLSGLGWNAMLARFHTGPLRSVVPSARPRAIAAPRPGVVVRGFLSDDGADLAEVESGEVRRPTSGEPGDMSLRATNAQGKVLASAPMRVQHGHSDTPGTPTPYTSFEGFVPAVKAASVQVLQNGTVIGRRDRSAHAPTVRLLSPAPGTRIGRRRTVLVRWRASDADRTPVDVTVDYSADAGHTFRRVYMGPDSGKVSLPRGYFSRARQARIRITAEDGFNRTQVVSGSLVSLGSPPTVRLTAPGRRSVRAQDATLAPIGYAFDDAGSPLKNRRLTWKLGRRVLGHGEAISVTGLRAGRQRLRLEARDRYGRVGSASVAIRLTAVLPTFRGVRAPAKVSRRAKRVTLTVGSSVEATLGVGRQHFAVGPRARKVNVAVRPGRSALVFVLKLSSGALTSTRTVTVRR